MSLGLSKTYNDPAFELQFNKKPLHPDLWHRLLSWEHEDCEKADHIKLVFDNYDLKLDDIQDLDQGSLIMFRHGYVDELGKHKYFTIGIKEGWKELIVEGIEVINVFNMDPHERIWTDTNLDSVVGDIANANNLKYETEERKNANGNPITFDYFQPMIEDMAFLYTLGRKIGYEVWVEDDTLYFLPRKYGQTPYMEFTYEGIDGNVLDFKPKSKTIGKHSNKTAGGGVDLETKQTFFWTEKGNTKRTTYLGDHMWDFEKLNNRYQELKEARMTIVPMRNKQEAEDILAGKYAKQMEDQITAELHLVGEPFLTARRVITVNNVGKYDGNYYVTSVRHTGGNDGYTSVADLTRNASFDEGAKYSRSAMNTLINKGRPSVGEFLRQTRNSPMWKYYERLFRL